jgi:hypothetical protein
MVQPVVIIGSASDPHVVAMIDQLHAAAASVVVLDPARAPDSMRLRLGDLADEVVFEGRRLRPACIYVRSLVSGPGAALLDALIKHWKEEEIPVYDRGPLVAAPASRGSSPGIAIAPRPAAIRIYLIDGEVAAVVGAAQDTFGGIGGHEQPYTEALPMDALALARTAAETLGLRFAAVSLVPDTCIAGYRVLAIEPSPAFLPVDTHAGTDVGGRLAARLAGWTRCFSLRAVSASLYATASMN